MGKLRQNTLFENLCAGEFWYEIGLMLGAVLIGLTNSARYYRASPPEMMLGNVSAGGTVLVGLLLMIRAASRNKKARQDQSPEGLYGVLHTLYAILHERNPESAKAKLRMCIFVPSKVPGMVHQLTDYVGDDTVHGAGRNMHVRAGVVGAAFRTGLSQYDKLPRNASLTDYLVQHYGFERAEASAVRQERKSWAALPVGLPGMVVAVIFLDSDNADFFGTNSSAHRKTLEAATIGIAQYVEKS